MNKNDHEMGFLDHLEELRWRLIKSVISILIGSVISFIFMDQILYFLLKPTYETLTTYKTASIICTRNVSYQVVYCICFWRYYFITYFDVPVWKFVSPGLKVNEIKYSIPIVSFSCLSFIIGVSFGYFILILFSLEFLVS